MNLINVICSNCGEVISIPEDITHATCKGCNTLSLVIHSENSTYTRPLPMARPTSLAIEPSMVTSNEEVYKQVQLLDNAWEIEQEQFKSEGKLPSKDDQLIVYLVSTILFVFGLLFYIEKVFVENKGAFLLWPAAFFMGLVAFIGVLIIYHSRRNSHFFEKKKEYKEKRTRLLLQLK